MDITTRYIDILIFEGINLLDVAGPAQAFDVANNFHPTAYRLRFVSIDGKAVISSCGLRLTPEAKADLDSTARDLLVPGGLGIDALLNNNAVITLIKGWLQSRDNGRLISICSGALLLANAGVLDGEKATTHWSREKQVLRDLPKVHWQMNALYIESKRIFTSAGVTTGIDLALSIIRSDHDANVALGVARELVVYLQRTGGQSQYSDILALQFSASGALAKLINRITANPEQAWTLETMAESAAMTPRTLSRRFNQEVGCSPVRFLEKVRVKIAADAIGAGLPVTKAISKYGFGDFQRMQRGFKRNLDTTVGKFENQFSTTSSKSR